MRPNHWMYVAILLLLGAKMVVDPDGLANLPRSASFLLRDELRNFEQHLQMRGMWKPHWRTRVDYDSELSPAGKMKLRLAGMGLIALALTIVMVS